MRFCVHWPHRCLNWVSNEWSWKHTHIYREAGKENIDSTRGDWGHQRVSCISERDTAYVMREAIALSRHSTCINYSVVPHWRCNDFVYTGQVLQVHAGPSPQGRRGYRTGLEGGTGGTTADQEYQGPRRQRGQDLWTGTVRQGQTKESI